MDLHDLNFIYFKYWSEYSAFQIMKIHQEIAEVKRILRNHKIFLEFWDPLEPSYNQKEK